MPIGRIANISPLPRTTWAQLAFPKAAVATIPHEALFITSGGQRCRAVRGMDRGRISTIYRVRIALDGNERVEGELGPSGVATIPDFVPHPWVTDNIPALIPTLAFQLAEGGAWERLEASDFSLVDHTAAHQRWRLVGTHPSGLRIEWFADIHHDDPVLHCWGAVTWSTRTNPVHDFRIAGALLLTKEMFVPDFGTRLGFSQPQRAGAEWVVNLGELAFVDGSGIPLTGLMLATPQSTGTSTVPETDETGPLGSLISALHGPAVGAGIGFDGQWLGTGYVPRSTTAIAEAESDWQRFAGSLTTPGRMFDPRPIGCTPSPGQTGDQEDFGCAKGTHVVGAARDVRHIYAYRYGVLADIFRGFCHRESDGSMLRAMSHPNWTTWTGYTHSPHSADRIGKNNIAWGDRRATGWQGYDEQHRSQNNLAAYMALQDDPLADLMIEHHIETDLAGHRYKYSGADAMRGQGRPLLAWRQLEAVSNGAVATRCTRLAEKRLEVAEREILALGNVPVLTIGTTGPDPRKPIYTHHPDGSLVRYRRDQNNELVEDPNGTELVFAETVSLWEMGLALVGFATAPDHVATRGMARTILDFGVFEAGGQWHLVADMLFRGGQGPTLPLSLALSTGEDKQIILAAGSGVGTWILPGLMVAVRVLAFSSSIEDRDRIRKGQRAILALTGGQEADSRRTAEWWAVVPSIASVTA